MLGNIFRRSTEDKQHVNKKQKLPLASAWGSTLFFNVSPFCLKIFIFEKELIQAKETANNANHKLSKNVDIEKILSVVQ